MSRTRLSIAFAAIIALALALPTSTPALAQGPMGPGDGSMMGAGMTAQSTMMGRPAIRGCASGRPSVPATSISDLPRVTINIFDGFYDPVDVTVVPGTVVEWVNRGTQPHSTTSWDRWSEVLAAGERCIAWFVTPGTYPYLSIVTADGGALMGSVTVAGPPIPSGSSTASPMGTGMGPGSMGPGTGSGTGN